MKHLVLVILLGLIGNVVLAQTDPTGVALNGGGNILASTNATAVSWEFSVDDADGGTYDISIVSDAGGSSITNTGVSYTGSGVISGTEDLSGFLDGEITLSITVDDGGGSGTTVNASVTMDRVEPSLLASNIVIDNTVQPNTITLTFDGDLDQTLAETEANWTVTDNAGTITYTIASASLSSNVVTLTLGAVDNEDNKTFITNAAAAAHIKVTPSTTIEDLAGNTYSAGEVTESGVTHTLDSGAPTVVLSNDSHDDLIVRDADTDVVITATFNEAMTDGPTISIDAGGDDAADILATAMTRTSNTVYTYTWDVPTGAQYDGNAVVTVAGSDLSGEAYVGSDNITYTIDNTAPSNQNAVFTADLTVDGGDAVTIVSSGDAANEVWFAPVSTTSFVEGSDMTKAADGTATSILAPADGGSYRVYVIDEAGNSSGEGSFVLTVNADATPPTLDAANSTPAHGTSAVLLGSDIVLTFDDNIALGASGNIYIRRSSDNSAIKTYDVTSASELSVAGDELTIDIDPSDPLERGTVYYVEIEAGAIEDDAGNAIAAYDGSATYIFTTVNVVINEIVNVPQTDWSTNDFDGTDGSGAITDADEWVELLINDALDLTGWTIELIDGTDVTGDLTETGAFDHSVYFGSGLFTSTSSGDYLVLGQVDGGGAMNLNITISLKDPSGAVVDEVTLTNGGNPDGNSTDTSDESVFRLPNGSDTDVDATDFTNGSATLGRINNIPPALESITAIDPLTIEIDFDENISFVNDGPTFISTLTVSGPDLTNATASITDDVITISLEAGREMPTDVPSYTLEIADDQVTDGFDNVTGFGTQNIDDGIVPVIESTSLAIDNSYIDVTFSEAIYDAPGGGALSSTIDGDFTISFSQNGGGATDADVASITKTDDTALTGGETVIRFNLNVTGSADGNETIEIAVLSGTVVEDASDNLMEVGQSTGAVNLFNSSGYITKTATITSISSLQTTDPGTAAAAIVFTFDITNPFSHPVSSRDIDFTSVVFRAGGANTTNWSDVIAGARLEVAGETAKNATTTDIGINTITFTGINDGEDELGSIDKSTTRKYNLKIWLNNSLTSASTIDNLVTQISLAGDDFNYTSSNTLDASSSAVSDQIDVIVDATQLSIDASDDPSNTTFERIDDFSATILATDANGNVDLSESSTIEVALSSGTGNLATISPQALSSGSITFNNLNIDDAGSKEITFSDQAVTLTSFTATNVTIEDTTVPTLSGAFDPTDDAIGVAPSTTLVATFSENIQAGSGNVIIVEQSVPPVNTTIDINDAAVNITGNVLTVTPASLLNPSSDYYVLIQSGAIEDVYGNDFAGVTTATAWNFSTSDDVVLIGTSISGTVITLAFDRDINIASSDPNDFAVVDGNGTSFNPTGVSVGSGANQVDLELSDISGALGDFFVTYTSGAGTVIQENGVPTVILMSFTNENVDADNVVPVLQSADLDSDTQITLNFSEEVKTGGGNVGDFVVVDGEGTDYDVTSQADGTALDDQIVLNISGGGLLTAVGDLTVTYTNNHNELSDFGGNRVATTVIEIDTDSSDPDLNIFARNTPSLGTADQTSSTSVSYDLQFDEKINHSEFSLADISINLSGVTVNGIGASGLFADNGAFGSSVVLSADAAGTDYTVTINNVAGNGTLGITLIGSGIPDFGGNFLNAGGNVVSPDLFGIDNSAPIVSSIVRTASAAERTNATSVDFTVTFSKDVTNLDGSDFEVAGGGATTGGGITFIQNTAQEYVVTVPLVSGDGLLDLDFATAQDIEDLGGIAFDGTSITSEETYTIDNTAPAFDTETSSSENASISLTFNSNERGTIYYVALLDGAAAPNATQLKAGTDGGDAAAATSGFIVVDDVDDDFVVNLSLTAKSTYDIFYLIEDEILANQSSVFDFADINTGGVTITSAVWTDLCLDGIAEEGDVGSVDIVIAERLANDIKEGTDVNYLMRLPTNYEFNTATGSAVSTGSEITSISISYPAANILMLEYSASSASLAELNTITISDLEVRAKNSVTGTTTFTRFGGTASIYGANIGNPAFVLGSVSSKDRPTAPTITLVGTGDVTDGQFRIDLNGTFDLTATGAGGTFDWIYMDGSAAQGSSTASVDETGWITSGSFPYIFDRTNSALYTVQVQETDGDGCVSDVSDVDIAVFGLVLSPNTTAFTDDDNTGTVITADFPSNAHNGNFDGPGLVNETIDAGSNTASVRFRPSSAGISNSHVVSYALTRNFDGEEYETSRTFSVSDADENLFTSVVSQYFCESTAYLNSDLDVNADPLTEPADVFFYELEAYDSDGNEITIDDPLSPPATWAASATNPAIADWSVDNWIFDPTVSGAGTFRIVRFFVKDGATNPESEKNSLGNTEFVVYDLPTIDLESNLDNDFCVDESDVTLDATIKHGANSTNIGFTQYRIVKETTPGSGVFNTANYITISSGDLDFSAIASGSLDVSLALSGTTSEYQIEVTSSAAQDPGDNVVNLGCTNTATARFSIYSVPGQPAMDLVSMGVGYDQGTNDYVIEYCDPDVPKEFEVSGQDATTKVRWYEDDGFGGLGNLVHEEAGTAAGLSTSVFDLFGTVNPAVGTHVFHFTQTHYTDVSGFDGCESDFSTVTVEIYSVPGNPVLDVSAVGAEIVSGVYTFEYCQGAISDLVISSPGFVTGTDFYDWYAGDGITIIDGFGATGSGADGVSDDTGEGLFGDAGNTRVTGTEFFNYFGETPGSPSAGTYTLYFAKRENRNTNGTFDGCSSSLIEVNVIIYDYPSAPTLTDALSDLNACSGELDLNTRIASTDEIATPKLNQVRYTWYDVSTAGTAIINADGTDVTYGDVLPSLTADEGSTPADGSSGYYELSSVYSATAYLSQTTNLLGTSRLTSDFGGCESTRTAVEITLYPIENAPVVLGPSDIGTYSGGTNEVLNFEAGDLSASNTFDLSTDFVVDATFEQTFNWFISNSAGDKFSQISVGTSTDRDETAAANELGLTGIPSDVMSYFLINQTTSIETSGDFDGCQSDYTVLQVNTWDKPSEPTEINGDTELYYCFGDAIQPIQVVNNASDNSEPNLKYVWYNSEADALSRTNPLTSTNLSGAEGEYINALDLQTDENPGLDMSGTPAVGEYTFYVTVNKDSGVTGSDQNFPGGESDPLEITIIIKSIPATPTLVNGTPTICDGSSAPTFQVLNSAGERFTWVFDADDDDINNDTPLVDEDFQSNYTPLNSGPGVYTYFVTQITNKNVGGSSFAGCESNALSFDYTINDIPAVPVIAGDGTNGANTYKFCAVEGIDDTLKLAVSNASAYSSATFNWYTNSNLTGLITTSESADGSVILAKERPSFPDVVDNTNETVNYYVTAVEDGCETSEFDSNNRTQVTVTINRVPGLNVVFNESYASYSVGDDLADAELCFENVSISIKGKETSGAATSASDANASNGTIDWSISTGGLTSISNGNSANINLSTAIDAANTSSEGVPTDHIVTFEYQDGTTGCYNSIERTITINPLPTLDIETSSVALDAQEFCFDQSSIVVQGTQETGAASKTSATSGSWILNTGNNALTDNLNGSALINLQTAMTNSGSSRTENITSHDLTFSYTDINGCENEVTRSFVVNPQPVLSIVYNHDFDNTTSEIELAGSAVCYEDLDYTLQGTHLTGNATVPSFATSNSSWSAVGSLITGSTDGTAIFNAADAAEEKGEGPTDDDSNHNITFNYTDALGCSNTVTQVITVRQLPTLDISIPFVESGTQSVALEYCVSTESVSMVGSSEGVQASSGTFELSSGATGVTDNGNGTAAFHPNIAHFLEGGQEVGGDATSHTVTFRHTSSSTGCTNEVTKVVEINALPSLSLTSVETGFDAAAEFVICESNPEFVLEGAAGNTIGVDDGRFYVNDIKIDNFSGNLLRASFDPVRWGSEVTGNEIESLTVDGVSADYTLRYEYDGSNGCSNSIEKTIVLYDQPKVTFEINGGCVTPAVGFVASTLPETGYLDSQLSYRWEWESEDGAPVPLYAGEVDDEQSVTKELRLGTDATEEFFTAYLYATYTIPGTTSPNDECTSIIEDDITEIDFPVLISPTVTFVWDTVTVNKWTSFQARELILESNKIDRVGVVYYAGADTVWKSVPEIIGVSDDFDTLRYEYTQPGVYDVTMTLVTDNNCRSSVQRQVNIIPKVEVTPENPYIQTFDGSFDPNTEGWYAETMKDDEEVLSRTNPIVGDEVLRDKSWIWTNADFDAIAGIDTEKPSGSGPNVWATINSGISTESKYLGGEDSWLYSPEFDLSAMSKPMVSFDVLYDFEDSKDGVVLQYSVDNGETWSALGQNEGGPQGSSSGLEWYNYESIGSDPGHQQDFGAVSAVGWSSNEGQSQLTWVSARHSLDLISEGKDQVRFRFAIASTPETGSSKPFGFAFDNFVIEERSKTVLVEKFYSVSDDAGGEEYNTATALLDEEIESELLDAGLSADQLAITYHVSFDTDIVDPFNALNTADPGARRSWYNVDQVTSLLDGDYGSQADAGDILTWTQEDLVLSSLGDPGFLIEVIPDADASAHEVKGSVVFTVNTSNGFDSGTELIAYVAIIEQSVSQSVGGISAHSNVLRKLLPDASGAYVKLSSDLVMGDLLPIGSTGDEDGEVTTMDVQWDLTNIVADDELAAVIFIQNRTTKEIYQAKVVRAGDTGSEASFISTKTTVVDGVLSAGNGSERPKLSMYPNPSDQEVMVSFSTAMDERVEWMIFDQTGRVFDQGVTSGVQEFKIETADFPAGVYFLSVKGGKYRFDHKKLLINH